MAYCDKIQSGDVPAFVRMLKGEYMGIEDVIRSEDRAKEALIKGVAELEEWRSYWEPILSRITPDLDPVFLAYRKCKAAMGDNWPLFEE